MTTSQCVDRMATRGLPVTALLAVLLVFVLVQKTDARGFFDVKLLTYSHDCREDFSTSKCDPFFTFCMSRPSNNVRWSKSFCSYNIKKSAHFQDDGFINFQTIANKRGVPVPWIFPFDDIPDSQVMLSIRVYDHDILFNDHDYMTTYFKNMTLPIYPSREKAVFTYISLKNGGHKFNYEIRMYCDANYYGSKCKTHCLAQNNDKGHFTCHPETGAKLCLRGWEGANCEVDINECDLGFCEVGTCENVDGDYECNCPVFFSGKNCSTNNNPCAGEACKNGATCLLNPADLSFTCTCPPDWTGERCDVWNSPCLSDPCLNAGLCVDEHENRTFVCNCSENYVGEFCEIDNSTTITPTTSSTTTTTTTTVSPTTEPLTTTPITTTTPVPTTTTTEEPFVNKSVGHTQAQSASQASFLPWHGILIAVFVALALFLFIIFFVVLKRRNKKKLLHVSQGLPPPSSTVIVYDQTQGHLSFENSLYVDDNANNTAREMNQTTPASPGVISQDELFYPTKPPLNGEYEIPAAGAEGGMDVKMTKEKESDNKKTAMKTFGVTELSNTVKERAENNPYQDFKSLTDRINKDKQEDTIQEHQDDQYGDEEDHYQELDEVAMRADIVPTVSLSLRDSVPPFTPPPRIPPASAHNQLPTIPSDRPIMAESIADSTTDANEIESEDPYTEVNKSVYSSDTLPVRNSFATQELVQEDASSYDIPTGLGPRPDYSPNESALYDSPRNSDITRTSNSPSEYNVPSSIPVNSKGQRPLGLVVTSDPWTPDPFQIGHSDDVTTGATNPEAELIDEISDDEGPELIQQLKSEVKDSLDFVLVDENTTSEAHA